LKKKTKKPKHGRREEVSRKRAYKLHKTGRNKEWGGGIGKANERGAGKVRMTEGERLSVVIRKLSNKTISGKSRRKFLKRLLRKEGTRSGRSS